MLNYAEQIPLPDELAVEPPSPYRRQKVVAVRRRGPRLVLRVLKVASLGVLLPLLLFAGAYGLIVRAPSADLGSIPESDVTFTGNHFISREDLLTALGPDDVAQDGRTNLFRLNLDEARRRIELIPWVKAATVCRLFPGRLVLSIVERKPLAFADVAGRLKLVDEDGMFLELPAKADFDFPVLYGLDSADSSAGRRQLLGRYVEFQKAAGGLLARSGWTLSEAHLRDPSDLKLLLVQGQETVMVHFGGKDYHKRLKTFMVLAPRVTAANPHVDSMDLRYPGEVVVDPFSAPSGDK